MTNTNSSHPDLRSIMVELIEDKFRNIKRKDNKTPYVTHLYAVEQIALEIVKKRKFPIVPGAISVIALGHDLHEDILDDPDTTFEGLEARFGTLIAADILLLSRPPSMNYFDFIMRLVGSRRIIPMVVKLADLTHNMSDLKEGSLKDKYRFAYDLILKTTYSIPLT